MKNMKKLLTMLSGIIFFGSLPIVISVCVHTRNCLDFIPGTQSEWFGFWASYVGAIVSVLIAIVTFNNQKKLEKLEKESGKLRDAVNKSIVGVNLRLAEVEIKPLRDIQIQGKVVYQMIFRFDNKANALLDSMLVKKMVLGGETGSTSYVFEKPEFQYRLQGNTPVLIGKIIVDSYSNEEKFLANFYFYFSQFKKQMCRLMRVILYLSVVGPGGDQGAKKHQQVEVETQLEILPRFDRSTYSNAIRINHYCFRTMDEKELRRDGEIMQMNDLKSICNKMNNELKTNKTQDKYCLACKLVTEYVKNDRDRVMNLKAQIMQVNPWAYSSFLLSSSALFISVASLFNVIVSSGLGQYIFAVIYRWVIFVVSGVVVITFLLHLSKYLRIYRYKDYIQLALEEL